MNTDDRELMAVGVLGLGEAGQVIARDLSTVAHVRAYDPAVQAAPRGVTLERSAADVAAASEVVLAITPARHAREALRSVATALPLGALYADLATASPGLKRTLAGDAEEAGVAFADVALLGTVASAGLATPAVASGPAAHRLAERMNPLGMQLTPVGEEAGAAATRKLLRSVVLKGLAALLVESHRAAHAAGLAHWFWEHVTEQLEAADAALARRLVEGTGLHASRRVEEMEAARDMLTELGEDPYMTSATLEVLRSVLERGVPEPGGDPRAHADAR
jgi:3-hydroxyisobutyrate dehydrogenase-like beta-hydroxyacid dehydrogenase